MGAGAEGAGAEGAGAPTGTGIGADTARGEGTNDDDPPPGPADRVPAAGLGSERGSDLTALGSGALAAEGADSEEGTVFLDVRRITT